MNQEMRIEKIEAILDQNPHSMMEVRWQDSLENMAVHKIPLKYLVYNQYNGRILTRTQSYEAFGNRINPETEEGKTLIEKLLWESKEHANKSTLENIKKYQQEKPGIITKDGIIIDGNRRAMLLNKIPEIDYFKAVVLPVKLEDDPVGIEKLETSYQMGEDKKLDYNPTEKYLKSKNLSNRGVSIDQIAEWMGESKSKVQEYLKVMEVMDDYLDYYDYQNCYTQLDGREDLFISLANWIDIYRDRDSEKGFDGYREDDVNDLELVCYAYIRAKFEGKSFRTIAQGRKASHFFGDQEIWSKFRDNHFTGIESIEGSEKKPDFSAHDVTANLNARDAKFAQDSKELITKNFKEAEESLRNNQHKGEPEKLVTEALKKVKVAARNNNSNKPEVVEEAKKLHKVVSKILKSSPLEILKTVLEQLEDIDLESSDNQESEQIHEVLRKIQLKINQWR